MSYLARMQRNVHRGFPEDADAFARFQRAMFGDTGHQLDAAYTAWLYGPPTKGPGEAPQLWTFCRKGEILGQQGGIPFNLHVGSEIVRASWGVDLVVHPDWRLRGVGPILAQAYSDASAITCGLGVSDEAQKAFVRSGWTDLGYVPLFVRPLTGPRMIEGLRRFGYFTPGLADKGAAPALRVVDALQSAVAFASGATVQVVQAFDGRIDALWRNVSGHYSVIARRDLAWLRWRFDECPGAGAYTRLILQRRDRVLGYAVLKTKGEDGIIVDYLTTPKWIIPLIAQCLERLRDQEASAAYCLTQNAPAERLLQVLGFVRRPEGARMLFRCKDVSEKAAALLAHRHQWYITAGDSDRDPPGVGAPPTAPGQSRGGGEPGTSR